MNELDELRAEYRRDLPAKLERLRTLWAEQKLAELRRAIHTLAGSAGTFGLKSVSVAAHEAETYLDACGPALDNAQKAGFQELLEAICSRGALAQASGPT